MPSPLTVRVLTQGGLVDLQAELLGAGPDAAAAYEAASGAPVRALLTGDRDYAVTLANLSARQLELLRAREGRYVFVRFPGRFMVLRRLARLAVAEQAPPVTPVEPTAGALDLTEGRAGAAPLWLLPDGRFSASAASPMSPAARAEALVNAARWVSTRRKTTFERLFAPSAFHPDLPVRTERLTLEQGRGLLAQLAEVLTENAVSSERARQEALEAAQARSAVATVLSHLIATSLHDPGFASLSEQAAARVFELIDAEQGAPAARPALRAHAISLLQMRAPALVERDRARAKALLAGLVRSAPPYEELRGPWNFAMCSADEFHDGECDILVQKFRFEEIEVPADTPAGPRSWARYRAFEAPFPNLHGDPIRVFARAASPSDENHEMGQPFFVGVLINRHAQLGAFDMRAATTTVTQRGYKLMMNSQCAGLTTRFAIGRIFPDADIYSSWDSTYFRKDFEGRKVVASEGLDCFHALLQGMAKGESHAGLDARMRRVQWQHPQARAVPNFSQFVGPANPLVVARYSDVNRDGRADFYDGFLDFHLAEIAEDLRASITPRDPGVRPTQVSGEAATGLGWAAGSMNRVTQYSDIWAGLPGESEHLYAFFAGGFYSHREPPADLQAGASDRRHPGRLPAVVRYERVAATGELRAEVLFHAWLSHAAKELKRLLVAADAMDRAFELGLLDGEPRLRTREGRRAALLLTLAGLLEYPADQNTLDGLWGMALSALGLPEISRSVVRACITEADHDMSNYYGSRRGLAQLLETLQKSDPVAFARLQSADASVGRAAELGV